MAEESYPEDLRYHVEHDWARVDGEQATFGITWYAQEALGEVVFFEPPKVGDVVNKDKPYAEVESVKAVSDVYAPLSGEIVEINEELGDHLDLLAKDPFGAGWIVKFRISHPNEVEALMTAEQYEKHCKDEAAKH